MGSADMGAHLLPSSVRSLGGRCRRYRGYSAHRRPHRTAHTRVGEARPMTLDPRSSRGGMTHVVAPLAEKPGLTARMFGLPVGTSTLAMNREPADQKREQARSRRDLVLSQGRI